MASQPDRPHARYPLAATVEIREAGAGAAVLAQLGNISLSGCYLLTARTLPEHARVRVVLHAGKLTADVWGVVRRRDQNGVGIQFTNGTTVEDWKSLEAIVQQLQSTKAQAATAGI